jgi:hypothetical protein
MDEMFFDNEITSEARARRRTILALLRKTLWTLLILSGFLGLLLPLTIYLHWESVPLASLLGLLAGISITGGILASLQSRTVIMTLLGILVLPGMAVYLSLMAVRGPETLAASNAVITPFVVYAVAGSAAGRILAWIWRKRTGADGDEAGSQAGPAAPREAQTGGAVTNGPRKEQEK